MKDLSQNLFGLTSGGASGLAEPLRRDEFWALQNISFELKKGEAIGIIGTNGSGKSTLLRILAGIFPPDCGDIAIRGRIGALIAVGAGFHPHMTGRENIRLNSAILGMKSQELDKCFDAIVDFADIGAFLDAPVATYSSGMTVRLGFSIAVHANTDILLADEVLAVGDLQFALKCYRRITEFKRNGGAIILVSHSMQLVRNVCQRALWLEQGRERMQGVRQDVCDAFEGFMMAKEKESSGKSFQSNVLNYDPRVKISGVLFLSGEETRNAYCVGDPFSIVVTIDSGREIMSPILTLTIYSVENFAVVSNVSAADGHVTVKWMPGQRGIRCDFGKMQLKPGIYSLSVTLSEFEVSNHVETHEKTHSFVVENGGDVGVSYGIFNPFPRWSEM